MLQQHMWERYQFAIGLKEPLFFVSSFFAKTTRVKIPEVTGLLLKLLCPIPHMKFAVSS
jgi:hypothetical protein